MKEKYRTYKRFELPHIEREIYSFWKEEGIFQKSIGRRSKSEAFTFYEGPPSANGTPGIHHVMARTIKDIFCRYHTLKGKKVHRKAGWDTHGLPIELSVEKTLGITKEDIGTKISVAEYNKICSEQVLKYTKEWDELTEKIGYWVDLENPYVTCDNNYIETVWWLLKQLYEKELLYKGYSVQPYSPKAGSSLSSHELNQPGCYRKVKDVSITAQFKIIRNEQSEFLFSTDDEELFFLAWTTTPWTLPSNCALAVGKKIEYVKVETFNPYTKKPIGIVFAKNLIDKQLDKRKFFRVEDRANLKINDKTKNVPYFITEFEGHTTVKGKQLCGIRYEQLMPYITNKNLKENAFKVIPGDFVDTEEGTGIVHTASVFGADDYRVCTQHNIPSVLVEDKQGNMSPLVDKQGRFVKEVTNFALRYVKEEYYSEEERASDDFKSTDVLIAIKLKTENKAFWVEKYEHSYPFCWRTDKPVLYYPIESWFVRTTAYRKQLIELNNTINWKPTSTGTGRFGNWLETIVDWNLSRSRFWGTPLPIWRTEDLAEEKCIGSLDELKEEARMSLEKGFISQDLFAKIERREIDLHKPYIDDVVLVSDSGKKMFRENDLIDVWFDSGAMPFAQWHYPFENKEKFEKAYPADFISEAVDQTRGWFFTLHAISVLLNERVSFKNVVSTGLLLDKNGNKMSKRLGNTVDPFETIDLYGADTIRWYMMNNASPWENLRFDINGLEETKRKFFGTLFNTYSFFALYANIDNFDYSEPDIPYEERTELDRYILSNLHSLIQKVDQYYDDYEPTLATRAISRFLDSHLSNWYVRLSRRRFWKSATLEEKDKLSAFQTLYTCLVTISKLISPVAPFYSDCLYKDLNKITKLEQHESVHLTDFPSCNKAYIDADLENRMHIAQTICSLVFSIRKKVNINVRQPLQRIAVPVLDEKFSEQVNQIKDIILSETNVKEIIFIDGDSDIVIKKIKPNYKALGPKYGREIKDVVAAINNFSRKDIDCLEREKSIFVASIDREIELDDVEIYAEDVPGWNVVSAGRITVALDIRVSEELKEEGIARELVNRIQNLRKEKGFEVTDRIEIQIESNDYFESSIENQKHYIIAETLAQEIKYENIDNGNVITIDNRDISINLLKV